MSSKRKEKPSVSSCENYVSCESEVLVRHSGTIKNKKSNSYEQMKKKSEKYINMFSI